MKRLLSLVMALAIISLLVASLGTLASAAGPETVNYGGYTLNSPWTTTHWGDVWDLTQGDLTLSYTVDMTGIHLTGTWNTWDWSTAYAEIGLRGEGAADFNPEPFNVYQGRCGGWLTSHPGAWLDEDGYTESGNPDPDGILDLDDKHCLAASGGRGEGDYDVLLSDPDTVLDPKVGGTSNYGLWYDRDGVDPWQDNDPLTPPPGGSTVPWGQQDGRKTYDTGGIYDIEVTYHAIDDGLGAMFATVNGVPQGFYITHYDGAPDYYPAGLSFKGDMKHMQVFAGIWAASNLGPVEASDITVTGFRGVSDPLVADFTYTPNPVIKGGTVQFTDATHGGYPERTYLWDFGDGATSTDQNPTHAYAAVGDYNVKLTVTPARCVPKSVTKKITVEPSFKVISICPIKVVQTCMSSNIKITGRGFQEGATVKLVMGTQVINATKVKFVSSTELVATFKLLGAKPGTYDVVVTNSDGEVATLSPGLTITAGVCGAGSGTATIMFGITLGLLSVAGSGHLFRRRRRKRC